MDEHFTLFLGEFGSGQNSVPVQESFLKAYATRLPSSYLEFVKAQGFASYAGGRLWTVEPDALSPYVQNWCDQFEELDGSAYLVFARSAFGEAYAVQETSGKVISVSFVHGQIWAPKDLRLPPSTPDIGIQSFFGSAFEDDFDLSDESGKLLFGEGINRLGSLGPNEIFAFEPALALGGSASIANMQKLRMDVHIDILSQLTKPTLFKA
jgi:hypothetical protein